MFLLPPPFNYYLYPETICIIEDSSSKGFSFVDYLLNERDKKKKIES